MELHLTVAQLQDMIWNLDQDRLSELQAIIRDLKTRLWDIIPAKSLISLYSSLRIIRVLILQESRRIVLNKIYQKVTPELTDEWVANNSESSKTVDEYKEEVKNSLQEQQDDSGNSQLKQEVQTALLDQIEVNKYPDGAVDEQVKQANDYYTQIRSRAE